MGGDQRADMADRATGFEPGMFTETERNKTHANTSNSFKTINFAKKQKL